MSVSNGDTALAFTFATQLAVGSSYYVVAVASGNLTKFVSAGQTHQGSWALTPITETSNRQRIGNW